MVASSGRTWGFTLPHPRLSSRVVFLRACSYIRHRCMIGTRIRLGRARASADAMLFLVPSVICSYMSSCSSALVLLVAPLLSGQCAPFTRLIGPSLSCPRCPVPSFADVQGGPTWQESLATPFPTAVVVGERVLSSAKTPCATDGSRAASFGDSTSYVLHVCTARLDSAANVP